MSVTRAYLLSGVMMKGSSIVAIPGLLLGDGEDAVRGAHMRYMLTQFPDHLVHSISVKEVPEDFAAQAAKAYGLFDTAADLLQALKDAIDFLKFRGLGDTYEAMQARAAIEKATQR